MKESFSNHKYTKAEVRIDPMAREVTRIGQIVDVGDISQMIVHGGIIEATDLEDYTRRYSRQDDRGNYRNERYNNYNTDRNKLRERNFTRNYNNNRDRHSSNSRSRPGSRSSTNRDRIRCHTCREYDHFVRDCPNSREKKKSGTTATNVKHGKTRS